jgi:glycine cleavage system H protein
MGNIVFVELPEVGDNIVAGDPLGTLEGVKTVEEIFLPISGEVVKVNTDLTDTPELINTSPYEDGWLVKVRYTSREDIEKLLNADEYKKVVDSK